MTRLLREAFEKASQLPEELQDQLAQSVLDEILWEMKWDESLSSTSSELDDLAQRALDEFSDGEVEEKGFDEL